MKLSPEPKARVTNMWSEAFFICSRGAYTIFLPSEAENTTFAIGRREQKWHFRPARQKKYYYFKYMLKKYKKSNDHFSLYLTYIEIVCYKNFFGLKDLYTVTFSKI